MTRTSQAAGAISWKPDGNRQFRTKTAQTIHRKVVSSRESKAELAPTKSENTMATVERTAGEYEGPLDEVEKVAVTLRETLVHANLEF